MSTHLQTTYQRLRLELGKERTECLGVMSGRDIQRFALASHAPNGVDSDRSPAGPMTAPPLFLSSVMSWGAGTPDAELDADGTSPEETRGLPLRGVRLMGAGQDLEFHAPVQEGMRVYAHTSLEDVRIKRGTSGTLLIMLILRRFADEQGGALVTCRESFIAR